MRWTKLRKIVIISFFMMSGILLVGFGKKKVDLLVKNLIDLDKAIEVAEWGDDSEKEENDKKDDSKENSENKAVSINGTKFNSQLTINVRIRGKKIYIDGNECAIDELEKRVKDKVSGSTKVRLSDDYAEAHIYREVNDILSRLSDTLGFEYDEN